MIGSCLFVAPSLRAVATVTDPRLEATSERHKIQLAIPTTSAVADPLSLVDGVDGAILGATRGFLDRAQMRFLEQVLARGKRAWVYWRAEEAIETVDAERLRSFRRLWASVVVYERLIAPTARGRRRRSSTICRRFGSARALRISCTLFIYPYGHIPVKAYSGPIPGAVEPPQALAPVYERSPKRQNQRANTQAARATATIAASPTTSSFPETACAGTVIATPMGMTVLIVTRSQPG